MANSSISFTRLKILGREINILERAVVDTPDREAACIRGLVKVCTQGLEVACTTDTLLLTLQRFSVANGKCCVQ